MYLVQKHVISEKQITANSRWFADVDTAQRFIMVDEAKADAYLGTLVATPYTLNDYSDDSSLVFAYSQTGEETDITAIVYYTVVESPEMVVWHSVNETKDLNEDQSVLVYYSDGAIETAEYVNGTFISYADEYCLTPPTPKFWTELPEGPKK